MIDVVQIATWLPLQRWFGDKGRAIESIDLVDQAQLQEGPPPLVLALARVCFSDGGSRLYHLALLVEEDGSCRDASAEAAPLSALGKLLAHGATIEGSRGSFTFLGPGLDPLAPPGAHSVRAVGSEQSNSSVVLDESVMVKLFRRVEAGPNPEVELCRLLTDRAFEHVPPHLGDVGYSGDIDGEEVAIDLGIAHRFLPDAHEGWELALSDLASLYDAVHPEDVAEDRKVLTEQRSAATLRLIEDLGEATAALHVTLAQEEGDPDFHPEPIDSFDLDQWARRTIKAMERELAADAALQPLAQGILALVAQVQTIEEPGLRTRVHGDYHLGQVVVAGRRWMILDLEGEPARPLEERREKQSPLKDVAGMLRSFSYAASAVLFQHAAVGSDRWASLEPWADTWESLARDHFFAAYLRKSHEGKFLPPERDQLGIMLSFFEVDKALYELEYERRNRPDWIRIPLRGIGRVIGA